MRGWLLDTNVVSELRKPRPERRVQAFVAAQPAELLFISAITLAEIRYGARRQDLTSWLERSLRPLFKERTLEVSEDVVLRWRQFMESGHRRGHTFAQPDLFVAAIAAVEDLVVVSRDTREFVAAAVPILDPWSGTYTADSGDVVRLDEIDRPDLLISLGSRM